MTYTHNLKIILLDNDCIIDDHSTLSEIKRILSKNNTHEFKFNGQYQYFSIKWDKQEISVVNQSLMGDLFSRPIYEHDEVIFNHTKETISNIDCKYEIKFYISRLMCNRIIDKNSFGLV